MAKEEICRLFVNGRLWRVKVSFFTGCYDLVNGENIITVKATATLSELLRETFLEELWKEYT
jgi:hypothetical protein